MNYINQPIFIINNFSFSYPLSKKTVGIKGKIEIYSGERILIKGPSGSGKSTLLLALSGIIPNEIEGNLKGNILFKGKEISQFSSEDLHRNIGIVFQNPYSQRVTSSIEDELVFYMENLGFSPEEIDIRLKKLYSSLKFKNLLDKQTNKISGGELQKVILASVLIAEPEVLLFDEPTSYLDIKSEISFYKYLKENLRQQTVITVDHRLNYNMNFINRIIELNYEGDIIYDGPAIKYKNRIKKLKPVNQNSGWYLNNFPIHKQNTNNIEKLKLEIKNLSFSYKRDIPLLKQIDLQIETGNVISIFGLNGSGKTTLIKLCSHLIKSEKSQIILKNIKNNKIIKKSNFYRYIGVVFQNPDSHFLFQSVGMEIGNGKVFKGTDKIAKAFNITNNIQQNPFTLSEGQKRRLNLANIFYLKKRIIFLDEPTFGQDEINIQNLINTINLLKKNGMGFLIVSHDTNFIRAISDKIFYLKNGKLVELRKIKSGE